MNNLKILDNAPEGATHIDSDGDYWLMTEETESMTFLLGEWDYCEPQEFLRSLADIARIVELEGELIALHMYELGLSYEDAAGLVKEQGE